MNFFQKDKKKGSSQRFTLPGRKFKGPGQTLGATTNTARNRSGSVIPMKIKAKNGSIGVRVEKVPRTGGVRVGA